MPSRKQRRRREKERRHEWEYVYVDEEGREVAVEEPEAPARAKPAKQTSKAAAKPGAKAAQQAGRPGRKVDPPSWQRVFRRGAIFAPIMLIVVYYVNRGSNRSVGQAVLTTVVLLLFFLPFSYMMDSLMYRSYRKRIGDPIPPRERKRRRND
jgi:hypothetical protein